MKFHPLSELFPLMQGREFDDLVADVKVNGVRNPIAIFEEQILDGRNRWRACEVVNEERRRDGKLPLIVPMEIYTGDDALGFVVSFNAHRRHLDASQRAMVAAKIATLPKGANQHVGIPTPSQAKAAEKLNVSRDSVIQARKVTDNGAPELVQAVESGTVSVSAAATVAELPKAEQRTIVERGAKEVRQTAKGIRGKHANKRRDPKKTQKHAHPRSFAAWAENERREQEQRQEQQRIRDAWAKIEERELELCEWTDRLSLRESSIDQHMTQDEYRLVLGCLHPDKHPDDAERYRLASEIFKRLGNTVLCGQAWTGIEPESAVPTA